jgi:hypothetical protein
MLLGGSALPGIVAAVSAAARSRANSSLCARIAVRCRNVIDVASSDDVIACAGLPNARSNKTETAATTAAGGESLSVADTDERADVGFRQPPACLLDFRMCRYARSVQLTRDRLRGVHAGLLNLAYYWSDPTGEGIGSIPVGSRARAGPISCGARKEALP